MRVAASSAVAEKAVQESASSTDIAAIEGETASIAASLASAEPLTAENVRIHEGTLWTLLGWGAKLFLRLGSNIVLTRLLTPQMFGISAMGTMLVTGIGMFADLGIKPAVVRSGRMDHSYFRTAWTVQILRGVGLALIVVLLAKPFAILYETKEIAIFLMIVSVSTLVTGFANIEILRDYRYVQLKRPAIVDNISSLIGISAMLLWAYVSPSFVALAVGPVVAGVVYTISTHIAYPSHNSGWCLEKETVSEFLKFGRWVFLSTILGFVALQIDRLALGRMVTMEMMGLYSIAWTWASMPNQILDQWAEAVFYPLASHHVRTGSNSRALRDARRSLILIALIGTSVMYAIADALVTTIYSSVYLGTAPLLREISCVMLLYTIESSYSYLLIAQGRPKDKVAGQALGICVFLIGLFPMFNWAGINGVIALLGLAALVRILWLMHHLGWMLGELGIDAAAIAGFFTIGPALGVINGFYDNHWCQLGSALVESMVAALLALLVYRRLRAICEAKSDFR